MSEEELKKLSEAYADDWFKPHDYCPRITEAIREYLIGRAIEILTFVCKDYCIVPKRKAVELQVDALKKCTSQDFYDGAIYAYKKIFDSELFEQKGE